MKNKFAAGLLALVAAFVLWAYVINYVSMEDTKSLDNVQVVFRNEGALTSEGRSLVLTEGTGQTVNLTITGNRSELMKLNSGNVTVTVDLSRVYDAGRQSVQYTVTYPVDVDSSSFSYTADQNRIDLTIENRLDFSIPVEVRINGNPAEGYRVFPETEKLSQAKIRVIGPESVVGNMTQAIIDVDLEGMSQSIQDQPYPFTLCDANGEAVEVPNVELVTTDVSEIEYSLTIQGYKYVPFVVDVTDGKGATEETSVIVCQPSGIMITGSDEALAAVDSISLGHIDLGEFLIDETITMPINMPGGCTALTDEVEAEVSISFPELEIRTFTISNIQAVNVPAGMVAKVISPSITVTVRGPKVLVQRMTEAAITVSVDFGELSIGVPDIKAPTVIISPSFSAVGIVNNGNVTVSLEEQVPETTETPEGSE